MVAVSLLPHAGPRVPDEAAFPDTAWHRHHRVPRSPRRPEAGADASRLDGSCLVVNRESGSSKVRAKLAELSRHRGTSSMLQCRSGVIVRQTDGDTAGSNDPMEGPA